MFDGGEELYVGAQTAPEGGARRRAETKGEFTLEHEDGGADDGAVGEKFEYERGGDLSNGWEICSAEWRRHGECLAYLIRRVGDAHIKVWQIRFHKIPDNELQLALFRPTHSQPRIPSLARQNSTHLPSTRFVTSLAIRGSISTATTFRHCSRIRTVKFPVPGPTSSTMSVCLRFA